MRLRAADALLAACFVIGGAGAVGGCSRPEAPPPPPPTPEKIDQDLLDRAFHDCFAADCERAHAHLSELSPASVLHRSDAFRAVQYRYDADRMLRADVEGDMAKRRAAYQAIADSEGTEGTLRLAAAERIARLGARTLEAAQEVALNARTDAGSPAAIAAAAAAELLRQSRSADPVEQNKVRAELEPKVYAGKASYEDVGMLRRVCKAQHDAVCLRQLDRLILH